MGRQSSKIGYVAGAVDVDEHMLIGGAAVYIGGGLVSNGRWIVRGADLEKVQRDTFAEKVKVKSLVARTGLELECQEMTAEQQLAVGALLLAIDGGETVKRTPITVHLPDVAEAHDVVSEFYRIYVSDRGRFVLFSDGYLQGLGDPASLTATSAVGCFTDGRVALYCVADDVAGLARQAIDGMLADLQNVAAMAVGAGVATVAALEAVAGPTADPASPGKGNGKGKAKAMRASRQTASVAVPTAG